MTGLGQKMYTIFQKAKSHSRAKGHGNGLRSLLERTLNSHRWHNLSSKINDGFNVLKHTE